MQVDSVLEWTRLKPFQPFKLMLTDGEVIEVRHPEIVMPTYHSLVVGSQLDARGVPQHPRFVSYLHIVKIEPLAATAKEAVRVTG